MKFEFITSFSSNVKALVAEDKDKYLALASLVDIGSFVPDIDTEANVDLLPIAFNACVVNRINKNGDAVDANTAISMANNFINKPINLEHQRDRVVGTILSVGYSEFGTDKPLTEEEVKGGRFPFNITLGGVVWKIVNNTLTNMIEDASDPSSEHYQSISASWELGFNQYELVTSAIGNKNLEDATVVTDQNEMDSIREHLKALGGSGVINKTTEVHRKVTGKVLPLGIGLTESPAAEVIGVAVKIEVQPDSKEEKTEKISQSNSINVIENNLYRETIMKIESLNDITDESMQQLKAAAVTDYIQEQLKDASEKYADEKSALEEAAEAANAKHETLVKEHNTLKTDFDKIKSDLDSIVAEKEAKAAEERFTERMSLLDEKFELNDGDRELLASDIKDLDDNNFAAYVEKMKVLMIAKDKEIIASVAEKSEGQAEVAEESVATASSEELPEVTPEEPVNEVEEALDSTVAEENTEVPNSVSEEASLMDKYQDAFSVDGFDIKL